MNGNKGMMTSLITVGMAGAAIYGITRSMKNGTLQRLPQTIFNGMNKLQPQQFTNSLQEQAANQNLQQQTGNNNQNNQL